MSSTNLKWICRMTWTTWTKESNLVTEVKTVVTLELPMIMLKNRLPMMVLKKKLQQKKTTQLKMAQPLKTTPQLRMTPQLRTSPQLRMILQLTKATEKVNQKM